jgi:hypothetical protein
MTSASVEIHAIAPRKPMPPMNRLSEIGQANSDRNPHESKLLTPLFRQSPRLSASQSVG